MKIRIAFFKQLSVLILLTALFGSCRKNINEKVVNQNVTSRGIAPTDPNDINLDPHWNFYDVSNQTATLYFGQKPADSPANGVEAPLPWFTFGNPINNPENDYLPELGWTLYLRDFGTPNRPAQMPFFALYNRYSGILRFFIYNYRIVNMNEQAKTYYIGELGFNSHGLANDMLSAFVEPSEFRSGLLRRDRKQMVVTKRNSSDTWITLDFHIISDNFRNADLILNVYGANDGDISLSSDFNELISNSSIGASVSNTSSFGTAITNGYEYVNSFSSLLDALDKLNNKLPNRSSSNTITPLNIPFTDKKEPSLTSKNNEPGVVKRNFYDAYSTIDSSVNAISSKSHNSKFDNKQSISLSAVAAIVGVVKGVIGIVKTFSGGSNDTKNTHSVIQYDGIVNTTGSINLTNHLYSLQFVSNPNAHLEAGRYVPLHKNFIGLIAIPRSFDILINDLQYTACDKAMYFPEGVRRAFDELAVASQFRIFSDDNDPFFGIINRFEQEEDVRLDSINVTILNNYMLYEDPAANVNNYNNSLYLYFRSRNYYPSELENNGINYQSKNFGWKNVYPRTTRAEREGAMPLIQIHYPVGGVSYYTTMLGKRPTHAAVEIKYTITNPNYPLSNSRERVFYKVIKARDIKFTLIDNIDSGCPFREPRYEW